MPEHNESLGSCNPMPGSLHGYTLKKGVTRDSDFPHPIFRGCRRLFSSVFTARSGPAQADSALGYHASPPFNWSGRDGVSLPLEGTRRRIGEIAAMLPEHISLAIV